MRLLSGICCGLAFLSLGACAPVTQRIAVDSAKVEEEARKQREIAVEEMFSDQQRLYRVTYPLITKAHQLCGDKTNYATGAIIVNRLFFGRDFAEATAKVLGVKEELSVVYIVPGSPAEVSGLRIGDVVQSLGGAPLKADNEDWPEVARKLRASLEEGKLAQLGIVRAGLPMQVELMPERACAFRSHLANQDAVNAYADGNRVVVTKGMMRFVRDDNELALVIGHELAHNAMGHMDAKRGNFVLGSILDVLAAAYGVNTQGTFGNAAASAYSQDFEAEADYVGLYMMAYAGLDLEKAPHFWRRMASAHPGSIKGRGMMASHPATPERFVALEEAIKEIRNKQASGAVLKPEMKKTETASAPVEPSP